MWLSGRLACSVVRLWFTQFNSGSHGSALVHAVRLRFMCFGSSLAAVWTGSAGLDPVLGNFCLVHGFGARFEAVRGFLVRLGAVEAVLGYF